MIDMMTLICHHEDIWSAVLIVNDLHEQEKREEVLGQYDADVNNNEEMCVVCVCVRVTGSVCGGVCVCWGGGGDHYSHSRGSATVASSISAHAGTV